MVADSSLRLACLATVAVQESTQYRKIFLIVRGSDGGIRVSSTFLCRGRCYTWMETTWITHLCFPWSLSRINIPPEVLVLLFTLGREELGSPNSVIKISKDPIRGFTRHTVGKSQMGYATFQGFLHWKGVFASFLPVGKINRQLECECLQLLIFQGTEWKEQR